MATEKTNLVLIPGEQIVDVVKTSLLPTSTNILEDLIIKIKNLIGLLFGLRSTAQVVITDKRLVVEQSNKILWIFNQASNCSNILPHSVASVDFNYKAQILCFYRKYACAVYLASGKGYEFTLTKKEDVVRVFNEISAVVTR